MHQAGVRLQGQPQRLNGGGLDVIGISPDKPAKLAKFRDDQKLTFPLLSDPDREVLTAWGAYGEKTMYGKTVQGVIRSTFVVDEKGKIAEAQYNVGLHIRQQRFRRFWPSSGELGTRNQHVSGIRRSPGRTGARRVRNAKGEYSIVERSARASLRSSVDTAWTITKSFVQRVQFWAIARGCPPRMT
jgi:Peroxiredoxin